MKYLRTLEYFRGLERNSQDKGKLWMVDIGTKLKAAGWSFQQLYKSIFRENVF